MVSFKLRIPTLVCSKGLCGLFLAFLFLSAGFSACVYDNFDDGDSSDWTTVYGDGGSVNTGNSHSTPYAWEDDFGQISKSVSGCSSYIVWTKIGGSESNSGSVYYIRYDSSTIVAVLIGYDSGEGFRVLGTSWSDIGSCAGIYPTLDTWYKVQVDYSDSSNTADITIYNLNGSIKCASTGVSVNANTVNNILLRANHNIVYFDDVGDVQSSTATETEGRAAIEAGIRNILTSETIYTNQSLYLLYSNGSKMQGKFDKVVKTNNQVWAFNYLTGSETATQMWNMSNKIYFWEYTNMTSSEIETSVTNMINSTME